MPLALLSPFILAQAAVPDSATTVAQAVPLLVGIMALSVFLNQSLGAFNNFRKLKAPDPVNPQENDRIKALEEDMRGLELRMERRIGEVMGSINTRLQSLESTISHLVSDFSRALGVLEGKAEVQAKRDNTRD